MSISFLRATLLLLLALISVERAKGAYLLTLTLSPNVYTTRAGGQITLAGAFLTADPLLFTYTDERLFNLTPASPQLGVTAGTLIATPDAFTPGLFSDVISGGGYLGPTSINGPAATGITDLRTFIVPIGTLPGTYRYSYGVDLFPAGGLAGGVRYDSSLTVVVMATPEPSTWIFAASGVGLAATLRRRIKI